jgi:hypothetical protein
MCRQRCVDAWAVPACPARAEHHTARASRVHGTGARYGESLPAPPGSPRSARPIRRSIPATVWRDHRSAPWLVGTWSWLSCSAISTHVHPAARWARIRLRISGGTVHCRPTIRPSARARSIPVFMAARWSGCMAGDRSRGVPGSVRSSDIRGPGSGHDHDIRRQSRGVVIVDRVATGRRLPDGGSRCAGPHTRRILKSRSASSQSPSACSGSKGGVRCPRCPLV